MWEKRVRDWESGGARKRKQDTRQEKLYFDRVNIVAWEIITMFFHFRRTLSPPIFTHFVCVCVCLRCRVRNTFASMRSRFRLGHIASIDVFCIFFVLCLPVFLFRCCLLVLWILYDFCFSFCVFFLHLFVCFNFCVCSRAKEGNLNCLRQLLSAFVTCVIFIALFSLSLPDFLFSLFLFDVSNIDSAFEGISFGLG